MAKRNVKGWNTITGLFDTFKSGNEYNVPIKNLSMVNGIRLEAYRRNRDARLTGEIGPTEIKFSISTQKVEGNVTVSCR